jgi:hypothetical protein
LRGGQVDEGGLFDTGKFSGVRAERRLGEMLREMPKSEGGRPVEKTGAERVPVMQAPTLADIGIDKKTSSRAQRRRQDRLKTQQIDART